MALKTTTQQDYGRRVARAMAYLQADPDRTPTLEELAGVAAFSPCHFHRIYRAVAGETPADTLFRARMTRAAVELLRTSRPIGRIARRAGYGSTAAFSRAFAGAYRIPPGAYRARGGLGGFPPPVPAVAHPPMETCMFDVTRRDEPALRLAAIRHVGADEAIGGAFDRLLAWATVRGLAGPEGRWLGVFHDDPETTPAGAQRSDAALVLPDGVDIEVPDGIAAEAPVALLEIPAQKVAVLRFKGPYAELQRAYAWLYGTWLPASGEEPADGPPMEEYLNDPRETAPPDLLTDILIPLRPR